MVSFFPRFKGETSCLQAACEFVFLVDRSGSMRGSYIKDAAQTLLLFLKSIPTGCYFNVICFGSHFKRLFPESVPYNQKNMEIAVEHANDLKADLGGTELFDPLEDIFSHAPMKGMPRRVFVLTDGSVSNTESVIKLVAKNSNNSKLVLICIIMSILDVVLSRLYMSINLQVFFIWYWFWSFICSCQRYC